jgi:ABC-2 type transport system ATP-binding protein
MIDMKSPIAEPMAEAVTEVIGVSKTYGRKAVVDNVSFTVYRGEIFGLIGPNGAGKTTTIRMMMDIIKPDSGEISILGEKLGEETKNTIGYLPEERGLYRKLTIAESLIYLASLKGKSIDDRGVDRWLSRVGMLPHKNKKIEELSRGMGQLIQFLATIIHEPRLIVLDEPFSGLDPVNTELLKELIKELRGNGTTFILSTHQMNQVEELCDRIMMINRGRSVLYGNLADIKEKYRSNSVAVDSETPVGDLKGVSRREATGLHAELFLDAGTSPGDILRQLVDMGVAVERFEIATPSLNQIFLQVAGEPNE